MDTTEKRKKIEAQLRAHGENKVRITRQRQKLYELILENPNLTCKELCFLANKDNLSVSYSTVYRTIRQLEKAGLLLDKKIIVMK